MAGYIAGQKTEENRPLKLSKAKWLYSGKFEGTLLQFGKVIYMYIQVWVENNAVNKDCGHTMGERVGGGPK